MEGDIYYFTRTGNSETIANKLAERIEADLFEIKDIEFDYSGFTGWFYAGYHALKDYASEIEYQTGKRERIFLITPVWARKIPPAVRSFIKEFDFNGKEVVLIANMAATKAKVFKVLNELLAEYNVEILEQVIIEAADVNQSEIILEQLLKKIS